VIQSSNEKEFDRIAHQWCHSGEAKGLKVLSGMRQRCTKHGNDASFYETLEAGLRLKDLVREDSRDVKAFRKGQGAVS
jgi:hypothetical protein